MADVKDEKPAEKPEKPEKPERPKKALHQQPAAQGAAAVVAIVTAVFGYLETRELAKGSSKAAAEMAAINSVANKDLADKVQTYEIRLVRLEERVARLRREGRVTPANRIMTPPEPDPAPASEPEFDLVSPAPALPKKDDPRVQAALRDAGF